jgi:small subunit ribosomal protein S12
MSVRHWIKNARLRLPRKSKSPALVKCPHKKAVVIKSFITTPRKPNSAKRKTAKVRLSNRRYIRVYFEGIGMNRLQPHSVVLVRGRGPRDLPGVRYHAVRGKFDLVALSHYRRARSKYGVKRSEKEKELSKKPKQPLAEIHPKFRSKVRFLRQRFFQYPYLRQWRQKPGRRRYWLVKVRLP